MASCYVTALFAAWKKFDALTTALKFQHNGSAETSSATDEFFPVGRPHGKVIHKSRCSKKPPLFSAATSMSQKCLTNV